MSHNWIDNIPLTLCFINTAVIKNDELSSRVIAYIGIQVDRIYKVVLDITAMLVTVHRSIGYSVPQYCLQYEIGVSKNDV